MGLDMYPVMLTTVRALFNWVWKVIPQFLWFCITTLCDWLKNLMSLPRPIRSLTKTNRDLLARVFPALGTGDMYFLRALIGSLDCLRLLWLVRGITLVLVLRHSIENRSIRYVITFHRISSEKAFLFWPSKKNSMTTTTTTTTTIYSI